MRIILAISVALLSFFYSPQSIFSKDYYETGYKYGKEIGWDIGSEEAKRCGTERREALSIKEAWREFSAQVQNKLMSSFLKEAGVKATSFEELSEAGEKAKTDQEKLETVRTLERLTVQFNKLAQNDAFGQGVVDGFAEAYHTRTKRALYKHIKYKSLPLCDWDQGYVDGHDRARQVGFRDKTRDNPSNWFVRYLEVDLRQLDSNDAQYLDGFRLGFKGGYNSGYEGDW